MPSGDEDIPKVRREIMISKVADIDRGHPQTTRQLFDCLVTTATPTLQITSWEGFVRPEIGPPPHL